MTTPRSTGAEGMTFDAALVDAVQAAVLREGIVPSDLICAAALLRAYRGHPQPNLIDAAAAEVWEQRHAILAARDAPVNGPR